MSKHTFYLAKQTDKTLEGENWPSALEFDKIANLHFPDNERVRRSVLAQLRDAHKSGTLAFDNIKVVYSWHNPDVSVAGRAYGHSQAWINLQLQDQKECELKLYNAHTPDNGWIAFLDGVGLDGSKALEGHACGCTAICTVESVFKNGLPYRWRVEGMHDDGLKTSFTCRAYPLLTAKQYFNFCADNGIPDLKDSLLMDWADTHQYGNAEQQSKESAISNPLTKTTEIKDWQTLQNGASVATTVNTEVYLLHLSDIHIKEESQVAPYLAALQTDLSEELKIQQLDYLVLSGDIGNYATPEEYQAAVEFVNGLIEKFAIDRNRIIIAPGNHDVCYRSSKQSGYKRKFCEPKNLDKGEYYGGRFKYFVRQKNGYGQRFECFAENFYQNITGKPYPLDYENQGILHYSDEHNLVFLSLNSDWQIDHHFENRSGIHDDALAKAILKLQRDEKYKNCLKIAVWHHAITGRDAMNDDFLQQLATNGFKIAMHGHIHEAKNGSFNYDGKRGLRIIGAGTFGAPAKEQVTGIPLQYNLLVWNKADHKIIVKTRKKEKANGAWKADARWGDSNDPKPCYEIDLTAETNA